MNSYKLSRNWFDFCFENPEKIKPRHTALYFFAVEHCNRLGWKKKFGFPTTMAKEAIGIGSYNTYKKTLDDLVEWGFIKMIQKSQNQYSSNIIALSNFDKSSDKSLDKALTNHNKKQCESSSSINKQTNKGTKEQDNNVILVQGKTFDEDDKILDIINEIDLEKEPTSKEERISLMVLHIWNDVNNLQPNNKITLNAKLGNWHDPIRLMIEKDDRTLEEIWKVWKRVQRDEFWKSNVLSTSKLREKFDQLRIKFNKNGENIDAVIDSLYQ